MKKTNIFFRGVLFFTCLFSLTISAQTFSGNTGSIPDSSCNENHLFTNFVSGVDPSYVVTDVTINIDHTWNSDLDIYLIAPDGVELELSTDNGGSSDNYTNTNFTASATSSITSGTGPFTGNYLPEGSMASLYGSAPNGDWVLRACDDVGGDTGNVLAWSITFGEAPALPCDLAEPITCGETVYGSTVGAPASSVPFCGTSLSTAPGVWYLFEGTGDVIDIDVTTAGSDYDTKLGVFSGDCLNLSCVAGNDDSNGGLQSALSFTTEVGENYYVYVTGFSTASGDYTLNLSCQLAANIAGDECNTVYNGYEPSACTDLTVEAQYGVAPYTYLWSTGETTATISACPTETTVYSVTVTDALGDTASDETTVVSVDVTCGNSNNGKVLVCHRTMSGDFNTLCIAPSAVQSHLDHGDILGECGSATCDTAPACDVVVTPADGATDVPTGVEISWTGASGYVLGYTISVGSTPGGTDIADNEDVGTSTSYSPDDLEFESTYYVTVTPYNDNGSAEGCGETSFTTEDNPCNSAVEIFCGETVTGSTVGASAADVPFCGTTLTTAGGAWYTFTGDGNTISALVATAGSDYDTKLGVFTGSCDALVCVGGDDDVSFPSDVTSEVEFDTVDGETYFIYVTGFSSNEGNYTLSVTCEEPATIACGETVNATYCYASSESTEFTYESADGSPLQVVFNSGEVENTWDELIILDSDGSEIYYGYGNSGDLTGLTFTSTGGTITVKIQSDSTISCQTSSSIDPWDYDVSCANSDRIAQPDFAIRPNPTRSNEVSLDLRDYISQDLDIQVMDLSGNVISRESIENLTQPNHTMQLRNAVNGMYFVRVLTNRGVVTKKLIVAY
ncbi:MAG: T9SS type A sorting domain-containing protein [Algicola sp.]|nr:T9SS type A sorting domain-containing protein [Algicola sp.]